MQKGSTQLLLVFVVVIILLGGGLYFYQGTKSKPLQSPNFVSSKQPEFNDYSNPDLGFSFKYAKELQVKPDSEEEFNQRSAGSASKSVNGDYRKNFKGYVGYEPGKPLGAIAVLDKSGSYDANPFSVWVFNNETDLTTEQWFQNYWYYPFVWGVFDYVSKGHIELDTEATVSGIPAKYKIVSYQPGKPKFMYVSNNGKMYLFKVIGESGDKILSTFKFTP